jgi:hypothetical protein
VELAKVNSKYPMEPGEGLTSTAPNVEEELIEPGVDGDTGMDNNRAWSLSRLQ